MSNGTLHRNSDWDRFTNDIAKAFSHVLKMSVNGGNLYGTLQDHWEREERLRKNPESQRSGKLRQSLPFVVLICSNCGQDFATHAHAAYLNLYDAYIVLREIMSGRKHHSHAPSGSLGECERCGQSLDPHTLHYEGLKWPKDNS